MKTVVCKYCGKEFQSERSTRELCSGSCKMAFHRLGDKVKRKAESIVTQLDDLDALLDRFPHLADAVYKQTIVINRRLHKLYVVAEANPSRQQK